MLIDDLNNGHYDYEEFLEDAALLREVLDAVDGSKGPVAGLFDEDGTRLLRHTGYDDIGVDLYRTSSIITDLIDAEKIGDKFQFVVDPAKIPDIISELDEAEEEARREL